MLNQHGKRAINNGSPVDLRKRQYHSTGSVGQRSKCPFGPSSATTTTAVSTTTLHESQEHRMLQMTRFLVLPHYQPQVHDKVTFESCVCLLQLRPEGVGWNRCGNTYADQRWQ